MVGRSNFNRGRGDSANQYVSKMEEGTGAGIYCEELDLKVSIPLRTSATVFQSETLAINES